MQITLIIGLTASTILLIITIILLVQSRRQLGQQTKELTLLKQNPDQSLIVLSDLMSSGKTILEVRRIDKSEIFLRSPRDV